MGVYFASFLSCLCGSELLSFYANHQIIKGNITFFGEKPFFIRATNCN